MENVGLFFYKKKGNKNACSSNDRMNSTLQYAKKSLRIFCLINFNLKYASTIQQQMMNVECNEKLAGNIQNTKK